MLQKRYYGFLKTPVLWQSKSIFNLQQLEIETQFSKIDIEIDETLRLGKYIERFVSFELLQQPDISIIAENIQIQKDKITLGELDCLLLKNQQPIHLEIIYKFYLYDASVGNTEIDHFIGPNRKDTLVEKLLKLKKKQLPLLYSETCKNYLKNLSLNVNTISQYVYFKAQLFLPYSNQNIQLKTLNNNCIAGYYINKEDLENLSNCKFYIPTKKDWLITPHPNVNWKNHTTIKTITENYFNTKFSTLCWVKFKNGSIKKMFLVWW